MLMIKVYCSHEIKRSLLLGRKAMTNLDSILKSRDIFCQQTIVCSRLWFFQRSCMDVRVGLLRKLSTKELMLLSIKSGEEDHFFKVVLEKTLESPLDCKEIQPVHPKGDQS